MAPISTGSIFFPLRVDKRCISLASTSLPVPFSPVMRIFASVAATFSTMFRKSCITSLSPQYIALCDVFPLRFPPALSTPLFLSLASKSVCVIFSLSKGFTMKSAAPSLMPVTASWMSAYAVKSTTSVFGLMPLISRSQYSPSLPELMPLEKFMSSSTTSGCSSLSLAGMELGLAMVMIFSNSGSVSILTVVRMFRLSSTTSNVPCLLVIHLCLLLSSWLQNYKIFVKWRGCCSIICTIGVPATEFAPIRTL